ncbi:hypothetical protein RND81_03G096100 [Saponaria officinalis]|uniref:Uncharacterized protein n=1 Tax=Saponaria officinalis TaxID=3572 RepID=A0AAW1M6B2_SAPOF
MRYYIRCMFLFLIHTPSPANIKLLAHHSRPLASALFSLSLPPTTLSPRRTLASRTPASLTPTILTPYLSSVTSKCKISQMSHHQTSVICPNFHHVPRLTFAITYFSCSLNNSFFLGFLLLAAAASDIAVYGGTRTSASKKTPVR